MKANELRIGNYVGFGVLHTGIGKKSFYIIKALHEECMFFKGSSTGEYYKNVNPIPLTEEWLLKFGFEFYQGEIIGETSMNDNWTLNLFKINRWDNGKLFYWDDLFDNQIQYVHQLQNLYFALTGKELIPAKEIDTKKK